jgi:hypothetical protein
MAIRENIERLKEKIRNAALRTDRNPDEIAIVAVTKTVSPEKIAEAISNGIKIIGENRVQEAKRKFAVIGDKIEWHMVGHVQTNKVKDALKIFSMIHSLDSIRLAQEIERRAKESVQCLIEVNTSKELSKYGIAPDTVFSFYENLKKYKKIDILGLMTIGPGWAVEDPEASRSCFRLLRNLKDKLVQKFDARLPILSMGMTSDYEIAVEEGANMVRVGTAIFGFRE